MITLCARMLAAAALLVCCLVSGIQSRHNSIGLHEIEYYSCPAENQSSSNGSTGSGIDGCPTYFYCNKDGDCKCNRSPDKYIRCNDRTFDSEVLGCVCVTFDNVRNITQVGTCMYKCESLLKDDAGDKEYSPLPKDIQNLTETVCGSFNRDGALCGRCKSGHYPLAYSFNLTCIPCPHANWNWLKYLLAAYLPLTVFYFFIFFFKINAVSSHLHPVIFYRQFFATPAMSRIVLLTLRQHKRYHLAAKLLLSMYGIWNFDFFRPFYSDLCLGIVLLPTLALDYAVALYPLFLMVVTYVLIVLYDKNYRVITVMWQPFKSLFSLFNRNWDIRTSVIDAFATFLFLSNLKILSASFDLLVFSHVYELNQTAFDYTYTLGLYYAADVEFFGKEHLPYAMLTIFLVLIFVIFPIVLLLLYPLRLFQRCLNTIPVRWHMLHTFVDSFQGCYKDGTEPGTCDCRWFASAFLIFRVVFFVIYGFARSVVFFPACILAVLLMVALIISFQPFKPHLSHYSRINSLFMVLHVMFYAAICGIYASRMRSSFRSIGVFSAVTLVTSVLPVLYTMKLAVYWMCSKRKFKLARIFSSRRKDYSSLENTGNWDRLLDSPA